MTIRWIHLPFRFERKTFYYSLYGIGRLMFSFFKKDPAKKLRKQYLAKLEEALNAQRNGKIREYSFLTAEAEDFRSQLEALDALEVKP